MKIKVWQFALSMLAIGASLDLAIITIMGFPIKEGTISILVGLGIAVVVFLLAGIAAQLTNTRVKISELLNEEIEIP